ncbi:hypothetical protein ACGFXC_14870 [Streptomyces sp. NPDC048507]|uniref:hypothetical protein n=1 Tax=Streptomyces sp. NPDC048507 TaxID=3365560 RepID=UPI003723DEE7
MRSNRRTTLRTAAVLTGAAAVLALPVGSAFADATTGPGAEPVAAPVAPRGEGRVYVATVELADGSVAKVYKVRPGQYEAELRDAGTTLDTLVSKGGKAAYGQHDGLHVVLHADGTVSSWIEGGHRSAGKPERHVGKETSARVALPDGRIAHLVDGPQGKRAEISLPSGERLGTVDLKHPSALHDGWTYKLVQDRRQVKFVVIDGKGDSLVYDFGTGKLIETYRVERDGRDGRDGRGEGKPAGPKPAAVVTVPTAPAAAPTPKSERVVPKGGVKAGAKGLAERSEPGTPVLLAAGGGMAAVGAAGLGFALLRRGRG